MNNYTIVIEMGFDDEMELDDMEKLVYSSCREIFDTFKNISVKIRKENDIQNDGYYKSTVDESIKHFNMDEKNKYDF